MNDNIIKTHFFHNTKFHLKGHIMSNKAFYVLKFPISEIYIFCLNSNLIKTIYE